MANDLTTTTSAAPAIDQPKWLTHGETSALSDRGTMLPFDPRAAVATFEPQRLRELVLRYEAALMPADDRKLAARLRALWESTTAPGNLTARSWLHEAARLLGDLPYGIAHRAIDQAVLTSERGFTPSIAAIRSAAEPMLFELRRHAARLRAVKDAAERPVAAEPADHPHAPGPFDGRSTGDILAEVWPTMAQHEVSRDGVVGGLDPDRTCRAPSRADYLALGVPAALLDQIEAEQDGELREAA